MPRQWGEEGEAPVIPWDEWYEQQADQTRQGKHMLFCGPTQSGKTLLCRLMARLHDYVVVFGTKPVDPSLDDYVDEGYMRVDHWPLTKKDISKQVQKWGSREDGTPNAIRVVLWPKIKKRDDLLKYRDLYSKCIDDVFIEGSWTVVMDEGLWLADRHALDLGPQMSQMAFGAASNKVSMYLLVQRPANVPRVTWSSCSQALLFHMGVTDDINELASLGVYPKQMVKHSIETLDEHEFLDLPCRGGAEWAISKVDMDSSYVVEQTRPE